MFVPKKTGDRIIFAVVVIFTVLFLLSRVVLRDSLGDTAEIIVDGKCVQKVSLNEEKEYKITCKGGFNIVRTGRGSAAVISSDCADKTCIKMGRVFHRGDAAVCLPHKFILKISGTEHRNDVDAVSR